MEQTAVIAIVDDDPFARKAVARLLRSAGYEADLYESGFAFFDAIDTQPPRCIVLDLNMPDCSGFAVLDALRTRGLTVPVVVLTGDDSQVSMDRATDLGAVAYLTKPLDGEKLLSTVFAALRG